MFRLIFNAVCVRSPERFIILSCYYAKVKPFFKKFLQCAEKGCKTGDTVCGCFMVI